MFKLASFALFLSFFVAHGCSGPGSGPGSGPAPRLQHKAEGSSPEVIALYEAWWGHPRHISIGYSSQDPNEINSQIHHAQAMGISAFVVDWYGDREPFIDRSYALMQQAAHKDHFHVAMMYDETNEEDGATDEAIADFTMFHDTYLASSAPGHQAYLTYEGRPVIFIFPKSGHTDWAKVRAVVDQWKPAPLLIQENLPGADAGAFDGFYAWIQPGQKGWAQDGSNWGEQYLSNFYDTLKMKYPDKIIVGGAWAEFDDSKASWSLNRHIAARCGQTFKDTFNFWRREFAPGEPIPFIMIETWNDYEEGTAIERGIPTCGSGPQETPLALRAAASSIPQPKP
ncbi:MAG TPA: hypothetical protein VGF96_03430 [Terracidiphilus sp.]|jgi:hypothetical protein